MNEGGYIKESLDKQAVVYIFKITSNKTRYYIGSTINLSNRLSAHRSSINRKKSGVKIASSIFYNSVLKYGWNNVKFGVLESLDLSNITDINLRKKTLLEKEQYYLDNINPSLNICKVANSPLGIKRT